MTERKPPDSPAHERDEDEKPEFNASAAMTKKVLEAEPRGDGPPEVDDAARQEAEYPEDETNEG